MTRRASSAGIVPRIPRRDAHCAIRAALRRFLKPAGTWSTVALAREAGVPVKSIENAICEYGSERWRPLPADRLLSITAVLGADFTALWLAIARQGAFDYAPHASTTPGRILATMTAHTAEVAEIFVDGVVDDAERPRLLAIVASKYANGGELGRFACGP